jgi:hypothetical protein
MPDPSSRLSPSRLVRWLAIGVLLSLAIAQYFRAGTRLAPLTAAGPGAAADSGN